MSRDNFDPAKTPGEFGRPPDYAPQETSSALIAPTAEQLHAAARNEQTLKPLVFEPGALPLNVAKQKVEPRVAKPPVLPARDRVAQPAASETDSPSRGVPRAINDPGKIITGGFGVAGPPQYFPLDGTELRAAVLALFAELEARMINDLRFHPAITYPRVTVLVTVAVKGFTGDTDFQLQKQVAHERTSTADAIEGGFVPIDTTIEETLREFDDEGNPDNPPDRIRESLGIEKPRKQTIVTPTGRQIVDRPNNLLNSF